MTIYASVAALRAGQVGMLYPIPDHPLHVVCDTKGNVVTPLLRRVIRGESRAFYYLMDDSYIQTRVKDRTFYDRVLSGEQLITMGVEQKDLPEDVAVCLNVGLLNMPAAVSDEAYRSFVKALISDTLEGYQYRVEGPKVSLIDYEYQGLGTFKKGRGLKLRTDGQLLVPVHFRISSIYVVRPGQFWRYAKHAAIESQLTFSTRTFGSEDAYEVFLVRNLDHFRNILKTARKVKTPQGKDVWQISSSIDVKSELGHLGMMSNVSEIGYERDEDGKASMAMSMRVILSAADDDLAGFSDHLHLMNVANTNGQYESELNHEYLLLPEAGIDGHILISCNHIEEGFNLSSESVVTLEKEAEIRETATLVKIPCTKLDIFIPLSG